MNPEIRQNARFRHFSVNKNDYDTSFLTDKKIKSRKKNHGRPRFPELKINK